MKLELKNALGLKLKHMFSAECGRSADKKEEEERERDTCGRCLSAATWGVQLDNKKGKIGGLLELFGSSLEVRFLRSEENFAVLTQPPSWIHYRHLVMKRSEYSRK